MPPAESTMMELGTEAPDFALTDVVSGREVTRGAFAGRPLLVMFICNHCPFVVHVREELASIGRDFFGEDSGKLGVVAISSNNVETHPDDSPDKMKDNAAEAGFVFPYCYDESQEVAKAYTAACTPDFFLFDSSHRLAYRGQLDDSRPSNGRPVTGEDLRSAIAAVLAGENPAADQLPSIGCGIKWKPGNEPAYAG